MCTTCVEEKAHLSPVNLSGSHFLSPLNDFLTAFLHVSNTFIDRRLSLSLVNRVYPGRRFALCIQGKRERKRCLLPDERNERDVQNIHYFEHTPHTQQHTSLTFSFSTPLITIGVFHFLFIFFHHRTHTLEASSERER